MDCCFGAARTACRCGAEAQNSLIALGVCLVVGVWDSFYFGNVDPMDVAGTVFQVILTAFVTYKMFFGALGIDEWLTNATSIRK